MKKTLITFITLFIISIAFSQTKEEIRKIIKDYDIEKINKLSKELSIKFKKEKAYALKMAKINGWQVIIRTKTSIAELMKVINGQPVYFKTNNVDAAESTRTNTLHNNGLLNLNLEGQNMTAYIWDGGIARSTHQEYDGVGGNNRFNRGDSGTLGLHFHAAHVTGTIIASGFQANAKGMAPRANAIGSDWDNDLAEVTQQTTNGMLISNHSYSITLGAPNLGSYSERSRDADQIMYDAPFYLMITAAGNDGTVTNTNALDNNSSFDKLYSIGCAKNNLVIANANDANIDLNGDFIDTSINPTSSQGPTDDYRIKPDLTGNGTQLYSTFDSSDNDYQSITGTSMASPNVTGTLLLLQQYYNQLNSNYMKASTLKGLALHTADDPDNNGPDALFGWGLLNAKKAAIAIQENNEESKIEELTLSPGQIYSTSVTSDGINKLIASISWTDPAGVIVTGVNDHTPVLVNDLDIRITKDGTTYFPYKLTSVNTNTLGDNLVDPYERIDINGASGNYTITITHKGSLTSGSQNFSLIVTGLQFSGVCTPNEPENTSASLLFGTANFNWDNVLGATYELRYRPQSSSTWINTLISNTSLEVTGLSGLYVAQVRSICDNDGTISYSNWVPFNNPPSFVLKTTNYNITDFLNIYSNESNIILNTVSSTSIAEVKIYNLLGKELYRNSSTTNLLQINKSIVGSEKLIIVRVIMENGAFFNKKMIISN